MITVADYIQRVRVRLDDLDATPYLWSDQEIVDALNDSLIDAALRADLTVQMNYQIPFTQVSPGGAWNDTYALPSRTTDIRSVRLASRPGISLTRASVRRNETLYNGRPTSSATHPLRYFPDITIAGKGVDKGLLVRSIQFSPIPTAANTALVDLARLPAELSLDDLEAFPEIDAMWQPDIVYGITARLLLKNDMETYKPKKSEKDFAMFEGVFGIRVPASVLRERQTDVPREMIVY